jgi:hypothetical protein
VRMQRDGWKQCPVGAYFMYTVNTNQVGTTYRYIFA